jgi:hypothetical protein
MRSGTFILPIALAPEHSSAFVTWEQVFHDVAVTRNPSSNNKLRATLYWKHLLEAMHFLLEYLSNSFAGNLLIAWLLQQRLS